MRLRAAPAIAVLLVACSPATGGPSNTPASHPSPAAMGCAMYPVQSGAQPKWLEDSGAGNNPTTVPYVIASPPIAAGFLFGFPLRAGHPQDPTNKILWVVGDPRHGSSLEVTGHPAAGGAPTVTQSFPANSGPGEIYPSIIDVPAPGCWHFDLRWAGNHAGISLAYT